VSRTRPTFTTEACCRNTSGPSHRLSVTPVAISLTPSQTLEGDDGFAGKIRPSGEGSQVDYEGERRLKRGHHLGVGGDQLGALPLRQGDVEAVVEADPCLPGVAAKNNARSTGSIVFARCADQQEARAEYTSGSEGGVIRRFPRTGRLRWLS